jgi:hypothetical protein
VNDLCHPGCGLLVYADGTGVRWCEICDASPPLSSIDGGAFMAREDESRKTGDPGETSRAGAQGRTEDAGTGAVGKVADDGSTPQAARPRTGGSGLANEIGMPETDGKS